MKLNPNKCRFGVSTRIVFGHLVTQWGIEANPSKVKALADIPSSWTKKKVMKLNSRAPALCRFISKSSDQCYKFFNTLTWCKDFQLSGDWESAFWEPKTHLGAPFLLIKLKPGDVLQLYLAISKKLIYYVNKILRDAKTKYANLEKLILALIMTVTKLSHTSNVIRLKW